LKKVFLDDLPKYGSGKGSGMGAAGTINWSKSVGKNVHFIYDNIEGDIKIIDYNSKNRNILIQYKDNELYKIECASLRNGNLGGLLKNEIKFEYNETNPRRVDLRNLPRTDNLGISWSDSIGQSFYFYYDGNEGYISILDYNKEGQMLTLKHKDKITNIKSSDLLRCKIKTTIGERDTYFAFNIGDIIHTNYCTLKIIECFRKYEKSHDGNMKWYKFKCCSCGWDKGEIRENDLKRGNKGSCPKCGDGNSYPNKIGFNFLEQLQVNFIQEYSPDWIKPRRYDFYFELLSSKYILEMDGAFHKLDNNLSKQSAKKSKRIDIYKDEMAIQNGIEIIRIDCSKSELVFIKNNIMNSKLLSIFDLNNVDWLKCQKYASSSRVIEACNIYNNNKDLSTVEIGKIMKSSYVTICRYLKQGRDLGLCDYNPENARMLGRFKNSGIYNATKIICLNTNEIFNSQADAARNYSIIQSGIYKCISGKRESAGKHPETGEPLKWMYYEDYLKQQEVISKIS
jgi:hypothetical protein